LILARVVLCEKWYGKREKKRNVRAQTHSVATTTS
jgi:hypothetical protein